MGTEFKGTHGLHLEKGKLTITLWRNGQMFPVYLDEIDLMKPVRQLIEEIEQDILDYEAS